MAAKVIKKKSVKRPSAVRAPLGSVTERLRQFIVLKLQTEALGDRLGDLKKDLSDYVESAGYQDDNGHFWLELDEPVEVEGYSKTVTKLKRQKNTSAPLNPDEAQRVLSKKGLWEECSEQIRVPDEDAINRAYFEGKLSKADIKAIFPEKSHYSFIMQ